MAIHGAYPMLNAVFDAESRLRRDAFSRRIAAAIAFFMQGLGQFLLYGQLIAVLRPGPLPA